MLRPKLSPPWHISTPDPAHPREFSGQLSDISTLKSCAYVRWISTTLNLTAGFGKVPGEFDDLIAFCIH
jgi:hypothetical protein